MDDHGSMACNALWQQHHWRGDLQHPPAALVTLLSVAAYKACKLRLTAVHDNSR